MARRIIVMTITPAADPGHVSVTVAFWFAQSPAVPIANYQSQVSAALAGAQAVTNTELLALQNGIVKEVVMSYRIPAGTTEAALKVFLNSVWTSLNTFYNSQPSPIALYGVSMDDTATWSDAGVGNVTL